MSVAIGERFDLPEEGVHGFIDSLYSNGFGEICAVVIRTDDGRWASVDMTMLVRKAITLQ